MARVFVTGSADGLGKMAAELLVANGHKVVLHDVLLAFAFARKWPDVLSNSLEPGWVPTKMGGAGAPDNLDEAHRTQVWLATSDDADALVTGQYFYHLERRDAVRAASETQIQDRLLSECARLSGVPIPT